MDDVSLHGKDNQQAVEILKQTGPVVRLTVARHVNRSQTKTRSLSAVDASGGLDGVISRKEEQAATSTAKPTKGAMLDLF